MNWGNGIMYDLTIGLRYNAPLKLEGKYRYDFICIDQGLESKFMIGSFNHGVFVFRTIKWGRATGNVLIDLIDYTNVNAFDAELHGDCHFRMLRTQNILECKRIQITDSIALEVVQNTSNNEFYAVLKEQDYKFMNGPSSGSANCKHFPEIRYLLFTKYHQKIVNMEYVELAQIFNLQREHIWCNNAYWSFIDLIYEIEQLGNISQNSSASWKNIKEIIERKYENLRRRERENFRQLMEIAHLQQYLPFE
jgi:hypothetical protein